MPLVQCRTLTAYGNVLARRGHRDKARRLLTDALHHAQACGAGWHTDLALTELLRAKGNLSAAINVDRGRQPLNRRGH